MKYRIRIETYDDGIKRFYPERKINILFWTSIDKYGYEQYGSGWYFDTMDEALCSIDANFVKHKKSKIVSKTIYYTKK